MSILIKKILCRKKIKDVLIKGNLIAKIADDINEPADTIIDGSKRVIMPSFVNSHTHAATTILRGYSDDLRVIPWLEKKIWPFEAKLTEEDVYWAAKYGCMEMIKTGTTFFCDMYWFFHGTARAVEEMGIRSAISSVFIDNFDPEKSKAQIKETEKLFQESKKYSDRIKFILGPHAIYTVSENSLRWIKDFAKEHNLLINIHLSESEDEVNKCLQQHNMRPVEYLESIGFLGPNVITPHTIWVNDHEIDLLEKYQVKPIYTPCSNMKLASGAFQYTKMKDRLLIGLGTDGCASNNSLSMIVDMKIAALHQKCVTGDPTVLSVNEVLSLATVNGAKIFNLNCGRIEEGALADVLLLDDNNFALHPKHNMFSNLVYAAESDCIDTVICDGKILMQNRKVPGEDRIIYEVEERAERIAKDVNK